MSSLLDVDPRSLVVLHLVARQGSLSGAARELGWTHPAVSQHVRGLERRLGLSLVERQGRGVRLTPAGEALCRHADVIAEELARVEAVASGLRHRTAKVVRVAAFPTACATFVVEAIHRLHDSTEPRLRVEVLQAEPPQALPALLAGQVDLALLFDLAPPELVSLPAGRDELFVVLPRDDPRARRGTLQLADLADDVVIAGCPTCQARFVRAAEQAGLAPQLHHQVTDDYVLMQAMVAAGQGVAVLPGLALRAHHRNDVVAVGLEPAMVRRTTIAMRPETRLDSQVGAAVRALQQALAAGEASAPASTARA